MYIVHCINHTALVEAGYHPDNCYHNCTHAADVAQALHCLLMEPKVEALYHTIYSEGVGDQMPWFLLVSASVIVICVCFATVI